MPYSLSVCPRENGARVVGVLALCLSLALLGGAAVAQDSAAPFTSAERRSLRAGELVERRVTRRMGRHRMVGGTSWQLVRVPIEEVWDAVLDTSRYQDFIPSLERADVIIDGDDRRVIRMHHAYSIATADYYARVRIDHQAHELRFDLDESRPRDLRAGRGFLRLTSYRGHTIVSWGALADVGGGLIAEVFGPLLYEWMLRVPRCVRDAVEPGHVNRC